MQSALRSGRQTPPPHPQARTANFSGMLPNPEFYMMGRLPREKKA